MTDGPETATGSTGCESPVLRGVTIDDLSAVFHLGEELFTSQDHSNLYRMWDEYEVTGAFHTDPELFLVAEVQGHVVGFAIGTVICKARTAWDYGHLVWLGVASAHQGSGVARKLLEAFTERVAADGVRMLIVDTQADNEPAVAFFRRRGFCNPVDHVYMTLNLENSSL